jgi:Uma2 family endonuclease
MPTLISEPTLEGRLLAERRAKGLDLWDEVWEGTYFMPPFPNIEHQDLQFELAVVLRELLKNGGLGTVYTSVNVSDREEGWRDNFRVPDLAVFLMGNRAKSLGTHWVGGPDFATEIVSPGDRSRDKLEFYASIGVRELLVIDRDPWELQVYGLKEGVLAPLGRSALAPSEQVESQVLPISLRLVHGATRPQIEIVRRDGVQKWTV